MKSKTVIGFRFSPALGVLGLAVLSSACFANSSPNNFGEVTLYPGASVICASDPCTIYFEAPAGSGTHDILQDGTIKAGVAIGGQRVSLGGYSNESVVFRIDGTDLPPAYLTVIGGP
ncbi:MAG: hypothetical protein KDJ27_10975 [Gammaproteobacteria bacterium]|nr:hypothetical protein [Gammaproteobacteria bacterium]